MITAMPTLALSPRHACLRLGSSPFSVAGNCSRRLGCRPDGALPAQFSAIYRRRFGAGADVVAPVGDILVSAADGCSLRTCRNSSPLVSAAWPLATSRSPATGFEPEPASLVLRCALPWLVQAWLFGVAIFSLRSAGGFVLLERERRKRSIGGSASVYSRSATPCRISSASPAPIQYCECKWLQAPAVIGWFRPIVFLPR